jgi:hypothetical protein
MTAAGFCMKRSASSRQWSVFPRTVVKITSWSSQNPMEVARLDLFPYQLAQILRSTLLPYITIVRDIFHPELNYELTA